MCQTVKLRLAILVTLALLVACGGTDPLLQRFYGTLDPGFGHTGCPVGGSSAGDPEAVERAERETLGMNRWVKRASRDRIRGEAGILTRLKWLEDLVRRGEDHTHDSYAESPHEKFCGYILNADPGPAHIL